MDFSRSLTCSVGAIDGVAGNLGALLHVSSPLHTRGHAVVYHCAGATLFSSRVLKVDVNLDVDVVSAINPLLQQACDDVPGQNFHLTEVNEAAGWEQATVDPLALWLVSYH